VQEQAKLATFRVKAKQENVSGVILPAFEVDRVAGSGRYTRTIEAESGNDLDMKYLQILISRA
jgi:hypothetical protein